MHEMKLRSTDPRSFRHVIIFQGAAASIKAISVLVLFVVLSACASYPRIIYNSQDAAIAQIPGYPGIRAWADGQEVDFSGPGFWKPVMNSGPLRYLALSGGGSGGAFGAGVLAGWAKAGNRPAFDIVSGVSTGALTAPFAFLGPSYDGALKTLYTSGVARPASDLKWLPAGILGSGLLETEKFHSLVNSYMTPEVLAAVAAEYNKGRRLFIVTTNMDLQRPVVWDMGKIAASGNPDALSLFRKVMIASASIPGGYAPVLIDVTANGKHFQEMQVDGGASTQLFTLPDWMLVNPPGQIANVDLYVLINNTLLPEFSLTPNTTLGVLARAYSTIIKSQTRTALMATYSITKASGISFHVAAIDKMVNYDVADPFNVQYTNTLYNIGYNEAAEGTVWKTLPTFEGSNQGSNLPHNQK